MRAILLTAALLASSGVAQPAAARACESSLTIPESLVANAPRFVILGEIHGTDTSPDVFADIVCGFAAKGPVVVHLEVPNSLDETFARYLESPGEETLVPIKNSWLFTSQLYDGRGSEAFLALIERLGEMARAGLDVTINASQPDHPTLQPQYYYEMAMALDWTQAASVHPGATNLVLVGSYHARRSGQEGERKSAAEFLLSKDFVALTDCGEGGRAAVLRPGDNGQAVEGIMDLIDLGMNLPRGVYPRSVFTQSPTGYGLEAFDGFFCAGSPAAASPRAVAPIVH
jgi:hypothetical protein